MFPEGQDRVEIIFGEHRIGHDKENRCGRKGRSREDRCRSGRGEEELMEGWRDT